MKKEINKINRTVFRFWFVNTLIRGINKIFGFNSRSFFSQTGEDIIIKTLLDHKKNGFYIEVGCNQPITHSNTFDLYLNNGWNGICIDANVKLTNYFKKIRPLDHVVFAAISNIEEEVSLYISEESLVSTIHQEFRNEWKEDWALKSFETKIKTQKLDSIIYELNFQNKEIDLLIIDVEGHDFQVLKSINLDEFKPKLIVIEIHSFQIEEFEISEIYIYLKSYNYKLVNFATMNAYFMKL
jgi:FkbM family methyltransferase